MKPLIYEQNGIRIYCCDCREILQDFRPDAIITDPPYGDTSLVWDKQARGWVGLAEAPVIWTFGSFRYLLAAAREFQAAGYKHGQELIWEKHNGSSFHADRFKRVHELIVQWYRGNWDEIYKSPVTTNDATRRTIRHKPRPAHMGDIERGSYASQDGGPRLMRSVIKARSMHGRALHPTQKPEKLIEPLIEYSTPDSGLVLDPFMGSGTTLVVAQRMGRQAIGIETDPEYCETAIERLRQGSLFG